jgi:ATP-dependent Lhr-like helicase
MDFEVSKRRNLNLWLANKMASNHEKASETSCTDNEILCKFHPELRTLIETTGFLPFTEPQRRAIPRIIDGKHVLLIAPTGMGKTEAAVLPLFHKLLTFKSRYRARADHDNVRGISILYITPLRALNRDMLRRLKSWGDALGINVAVRHGDTSKHERRHQAVHPPDMLITTPETFQIMFLGHRLRDCLKQVKWIVIDEIHELADDERGAQLTIGLERLCALLQYEPQRIGLSATVGTPERVAKFLGGVGREVEIVQISVAKRLDIYVESPQVEAEDKQLADKLQCSVRTTAAVRRARGLIEHHRSTLLFVNTRETAENLMSRFHWWDVHIPIGVHHGSLSKDVRIQMEDEFKAEKLKSLICTSSLELGIDIGSADFTIQYNSPREVSRLVQRVGRASHRVGETAHGVIIATGPDDIVESCVIARRAMSEELEPIRIRSAPLGVLANQIVAATLVPELGEWHRGAIPAGRFFGIVKRAYVYRKLRWETYRSVLEQLQALNLIWFDGDKFGKTSNSLKYFYDNISMIPDEKTYRVVDISSRRSIASLDESFVASHIAMDPRFIVKGVSWQVVDQDDDAIVVEPIGDIAAVPSWVGEDIPVPYAVATEVGRLRRVPAELKNYPAKGDAISEVLKYIRLQEGKYPVPTDKLITIESGLVEGRRLVIINSSFGTKVNETLARLISALVGSRTGASVGIQIDPYRIILELAEAINPKLIEECLVNTAPEALEDLLRIVLKTTPLFRWQLFHVARKFGAIAREVDYKKLNINRLLDVFMDTPLYHETINKIFWDWFDIPITKHVLRQIQAGDIRIVHTGISPMGLEGYASRRELMVPEHADKEILMTVKKRLESERVRLICMNCKKTRTVIVGELEAKILCHNCNGKLVGVAVLKDRAPCYSAQIIEKKLRLDKLDSVEDLRAFHQLQLSANLILAHGKRAVLALVGRGIGPNTAARILARPYESELEFLRAVLRAEINYARTRRFWD